MTNKEREAVEKRFQKCCGKRPSVEFWNRQKDKQGRAYDESIGVNVRCRKCGAELYIRKVAETDDELAPLIDIAVEQWNVDNAMVLPYSIETNRKGRRDALDIRSHVFPNQTQGNGDVR